ISGYIVRKLYDRITCENCRSAMLHKSSDHDYTYISEDTVLTQFKNNGGLVRPSDSVFKVVSETEMELLAITNNLTDLGKKNFNQKIKISVRNKCGQNQTIFKEADA